MGRELTFSGDAHIRDPLVQVPICLTLGGLPFGHSPKQGLVEEQTNTSRKDTRRLHFCVGLSQVGLFRSLLLACFLHGNQPFSRCVFHFEGCAAKGVSPRERRTLFFFFLRHGGTGVAVQPEQAFQAGHGAKPSQEGDSGRSKGPQGTRPLTMLPFWGKSEGKPELGGGALGALASGFPCSCMVSLPKSPRFVRAMAFDWTLGNLFF